MMSWTSRSIIHILSLSRNFTIVPKSSQKCVRLFSNKEIGFIKHAATQDLLLQNLKTAASTKNILELVSAHHKIMNNKHLMQALRSLFSLQKSGNSDLSTKEIINHPEFKTLCYTLKYQIRSIELNETIEALKVVSYVGIASNSTIMQVLLQLIRHNVNNLSLQQIIFLDFLLKQFNITPISDALLIAFPIVFEVQLPMKIDRESLSQLADALQYASKNKLSDSAINFLVENIMVHKEFDTKAALSIIWSICDLKPNEAYGPLLRKALNTLVNKGEDAKISDLETTLTKLTLRFKSNNLFYYQKDFYDMVAEHIIKKDLGYQQAVWILQKYSKVGHTHNGLLDYIATLCHSDRNIVSRTSPWNLFNLVTGFAATEYRPVHWESVRQGIIENENLCNKKREFHWMKLGTRLAILDIFIPKVLEQAFRPEYIEKILLEGIHINCQYFLALYQAVSTIKQDYKHILPSTFYIDRATKLLQSMSNEEYPLQAALERGFGGKAYVLTNVVTKLGHLLHHVVIMRKGGYPVAFNNIDEHQSIVLENLQVPADSQIIVIFGCNASYYKLDSGTLRTIHSLIFRTIEASGHSLIVVPTDIWLNLPDYEKIPYLMQSVRNKNEEFEKQSCIQ